MTDSMVEIALADDEQILIAARYLGVDEHAQSRRWFYAAIDSGASTAPIRNWMKKRGVTHINLESYTPLKLK